MQQVIMVSAAAPPLRQDTTIGGGVKAALPEGRSGNGFPYGAIKEGGAMRKVPMTGLLPPTGAEAEARRRIAERGPITFAEYMEVALYWPDGGYYATRRAFGPSGDFYTAPLAHPAFGALVARQLLTAWRILNEPARFAVIEAGAGDGRLALDVLAQAPALNAKFAGATEYAAVDLREPPPGFPATWMRQSAVPRVGGSGVVLANELLDAMPVHRVTMEGGRLRELYVDASPEGGFAEVEGEPSTPALAERLSRVGARLSEGHRAEANLGLDAWFAEAFAAIERGYLIVTDYGHEAAAYYDDSRRAGTLRCYSGHTLGMNPYVDMGRQDIGAHAEFTSVRAAAQAAGFASTGETTQAEWLTSLGIAALRADIAGRDGLSRAERAANLRGMDALTDADGMGAFRVMAFAKNAPAEGMLGAAPPERAPAPLAGPGHIALGYASRPA